MTKIPYYRMEPSETGIAVHPRLVDSGGWAKREDVEKLQQELQDVTAKALAAVWLLAQNHVDISAFIPIHREAVRIFSGENERAIESLREELRRTREELSRAKTITRPGVNTVHGIKPNSFGKAELRYRLMLTRIEYGSNGGLEVEVQLP